MRPFWIGTVVVTLLAAACNASPAPTASPWPSALAHGGAVNPANIKRVARELPPGYEVTSAIRSEASPTVLWGFKVGASDIRTKPPQCTRLADPGKGREQSAQGVAGSGSGGIVDAVVVTLPGPVDFPHDLITACGQWTMTAGRTAARVHLIDAPHIDGAESLGMLVDIKSFVESGTEIDSRAYTFTAYLDNYYAFTTLTTDPGSALPALPPRFAADLLVKTVSTLRG